MSIYLAVFGKPRYLGLLDIGDPAPKAGSWVSIKTVRGLEVGVLGGTLSQEQEAKYRSACLESSGDEHSKGPEPMLQEAEFLAPLSPIQINEYYLRRSDEGEVLVKSRRLLHDHELQMKLVDVEYTMDRKKLFFYFTSEQRIDFRSYVRDLAKEFRVRIEMRQIGVRDEAKTVRGVAPCGRPCCCSYWLHRFTPINIRMVKEQNLALNPTKISGICGRLMCCMGYEHLNYSRLWKSLPSPGSKIKTAQGNYVLEGVDLQMESVRVRFPEGREVSIPIAEFADFKEVVLRGEPWDMSLPEEVPHRSSVFQRASRLSPVQPKTTETTREESSKTGKKFKPEKISIEEHIAERVGEKTAEPKIYEPEKSPDAAPVKKRSRRRGKGSRISGNVPAVSTESAEGAEKEQDSRGSTVLPQPRRERPHSASLSSGRTVQVESLLEKAQSGSMDVQKKNEEKQDKKQNAGTSTEERQNGEKQEKRSRRRRPRRRSEGSGDSESRKNNGEQNRAQSEEKGSL